MKLVIVESPFAPNPNLPQDMQEQQLKLHKFYCRMAMRDCLLRGEAPFASHALYTLPGVLQDRIPEERQLGIAAGFEWRLAASVSVVYTDLGISEGMRKGIEDSKLRDVPVEYRMLGPAFWGADWSGRDA